MEEATSANANINTNTKTNANPTDGQTDFTRLLAENLKRDEEILKAVRDIKKYIHRQQVWTTLRFVLIVIPIILGFIYLPPFIKQAISTVNGLYGGLNF